MPFVRSGPPAAAATWFDSNRTPLFPPATLTATGPGRSSNGSHRTTFGGGRAATVHWRATISPRSATALVVAKTHSSLGQAVDQTRKNAGRAGWFVSKLTRKIPSASVTLVALRTVWPAVSSTTTGAWENGRSSTQLNRPKVNGAPAGRNVRS